MPIAAVPNYLGQDFTGASPGLRFGMFLPLWGRNNRTGELDWSAKDTNFRITGRDREERQFKDDNKRGALDQAVCLTEADKKNLEAIIDRQSVLSETIAKEQLLTIDAQSIAPFTTGLGNEHPLENGFAFLWPYGLPYLPGSGVKGVLRQAARELAADVTDDGIAQWESESDWSRAAIDALFGNEDSNNARRGALQFWDVIPNIAGHSLMVEVMTAHQAHYHQNGESPHESGQPNPINFLTVPPCSAFIFHVLCDRPFLTQIAPELADGDRWKTLLQQVFEHAFDWLGFGAKTAVGYGAMAVDDQAVAARLETEAEKRAEAERQQEIAKKTAGLPDDAVWIETQLLENAWSKNDLFLDAVERIFEQHPVPSSEAQERLRGQMDQRWPGILSNPEATQGKKKKPKYKLRHQAIAKKLLGLDRGDGE